MRIHSLILEHFRNYTSEELDLRGTRRHLFLGPNASGKTNLLEAVGVLSLTKSLRGRDDAELVEWGQGYARVVAEIIDDAGESATLELVNVLRPKRRKAAFKNGVRAPLTAIVGVLPSVSFLPQDLTLFSGPPAERRRFLDTLLCQVSPEYLSDLAGYHRLLRQRRALLRRIAQGEATQADLVPWDGRLSEFGSRITLARLELLETLNLTFGEELRSLKETWRDVELRYARRGGARERSAIEAELSELLKRSRERDLLLQATTVGPHREDWQVVADGRELPTFASRGQERTAVLALLLLEVSYLELRRGERPILLLDEVFSELDDAHQEALLGALQEHQTFLTATRLPVGLTDVLVWGVGGGSVRPRGGVRGHRRGVVRKELVVE